MSVIYLDKWLTYDRNIADYCWISKGCDYSLFFYDMPSGGVSSNVLGAFDTGFSQGFMIGDQTVDPNSIIFEAICFKANNETISYPMTVEVANNGVIKTDLTKTITDQMTPGDNYLIRLNATVNNWKSRLMNVKTVCRL